MSIHAEQTESAPQAGLFPLSPEMLRRLFAEHDARADQRDRPITPDNEDV